MKIKIFILLPILIVGYLLGQSKIIEKNISIKNGEIELPGTLTYTDKSKDLIIWIHGSGNSDRDGNQAGTKTNYIKQFRNDINKKDIAFYSYDKRNSNPKNTKYLVDGSFDDLVEDAKIVVTHFKKDKRFDKIVLLGHSQGSLVGMLASEKVDKYISLAGPSGSIERTLINQLSSQNKDMGAVAKGYIKELKETGTIKEVSPFLAMIFGEQNHKFLISWMKYDANTEIAKLTIPILILNGKSDLQVPVEEAKSLHKSNLKSSLVLIDKMNHLLKEVESKTENMNSYYNADFPISKKLIEAITEFVKE